MNGYYRFHARIYDLTRWTFLFGRKALVRQLYPYLKRAKILMEVGSGSGYNLNKIGGQHPDLNMIAVDASEYMMEKAKRKLHRFGQRIRYIETCYNRSTLIEKGTADIVLISYCLTMINPGWREVVDDAMDDLCEGGIMAVTDFHITSYRYFRKWMKINHVAMTGEIVTELSQRFHPLQIEIKNGLFGLWTYFIFIGEKKNTTFGASNQNELKP